MPTVNTMKPIPKELIECPSCHKSIPIFENEGRWCNHCNWNLEIEESEKKKPDLYTRARKILGKKFSEQLFINVIEEKVSRPRFTRMKFFSLLFASLVHLSSLLMLLAAYGVFYVFAKPIAIILCLIFVGIAWAVMPKPRKLPEDAIPREKTPKLYELLDRIADAMGTTRVHALLIDEEFNAYYTEYGIGKWKKKHICIGLPLAEILTDEELVAVLAHETSHGANGDSARGVYTWHALKSLNQWYRIFTPRSLYEGDTGPYILWVTIANILGAILGRIPWAACYGLAYLTYQTSQEAEYIADRLATEVCGTDAAISLLYKLTRYEPFFGAVAKTALSKGTIDLFDEIHSRYQVPQSDHDRERINRLNILSGTSLDTTHPPAPYRRDFLKATSAFQPKVVLSSEDSQLIREELKTFRKEAATKLVDQYLSSI